VIAICGSRHSFRLVAADRKLNFEAGNGSGAAAFGGQDEFATASDHDRLHDAP